MSGLAAKLIAVGALLLFAIGSIPLLTPVIAQNSKLEYEVGDLQRKVEKLSDVPTEIALIIEHQKLEDMRYGEQREFENKLVWGFFGTAGGTFMALVGWFLNQMGVTLRPRREPEERRVYES